MLTNAPRGTKDILPEQVSSWLWLEDKIRELCKLYGYEEIRTPTFEHMLPSWRLFRGVY